MATKAHIYYCWSIDTTQTLTLNALEAIIQTVIPKETIQNPKTKSSMEPTKTSVFSVVCWNWAFFAKPYHVQTDGGQYWRELSYWLFFIGSGSHAAFRKYVNGDNRLTHSHSRDFVKHVQSPQEFDLDMPHIPCQHPKYPIITIAS